jgi:D-xylonolactonase
MPGHRRVQCIWEARAELGESPIWVDTEQALYFVDGLQGKLLRCSVSQGASEVYRHDGMIGFIAHRPAGGFIAGMDNKLYALSPAGGAAREVACPEPHRANSQFNDGKVDPTGRLWGGTMDRECADPVGSLYLFQKNLSWQVVDSGYICPNGPAFSPDGRILYQTDSMRRAIYQFDLDLDSGAISNRRVVASFEDHDGFPDGMTVDRDGRLWVAHFGGGRVTAHTPDGRVDDVIEVPAPNVTSCAFGGPDATTLFITTSRTWMSEGQLRDAPLAGALFACEGLAQGIVAVAFDG